MLDIFNRKAVKKLTAVACENKKRLKLQNMEISQLRQEQARPEDQPLKYSWNRYLTYEPAIRQIHDMYDCKTHWGSSIGSIIDLRAALMAGGGLEVDETIEGSEKEKAFIEKMLELNGLDKGGLRNQLINSEKEGKVLIRLIYDNEFPWSWENGDQTINEKGMVFLRYYPWVKYKYEVTPDELRNTIAGTAIFKGNGKDQFVLNSQDFVYRKYRGSPCDINDATSIYQRCLENITSIERCYADWRAINHLFAAPKPFISCETKQQAADVKEQLADPNGGFNLKTGILAVLTGKIEFAAPGKMAELEKEITYHRYQISMATGMSVGVLGDPTQLKNKNVAGYLSDSTMTGIMGDRLTTEGLFIEIKNKALALRNGVQTPLNPNAIDIKISEITEADWKILIDFYLPARESKEISQETFLERVPGLDPTLEIERLKKEKEESQSDQQMNPMLDFAESPGRAEEIEENKANGKIII